MKKNKAIPQGYMTVGEVAKKMNVSVRTLQYYDKEGLFTPSAESEGGRRLYTDKDMIQLHQILSLKHLGFSLGDIKNRLISLDTPDEVARVLSEQAAVVRDKIECLSQSLKELEALKEVEESFWENIQSETPPAIDGMDSTIDALNAEFPASDPDTEMDLTGCAVDLAIMDECSQQIKVLEEKKATAQARIMEAMGTAERGGYGSYSVTWKTQKRSTFDRKKWEKDHGEIPQDYFKSSESRTFRFKKDEQ